jgi:polyhydroxybutyrate depolymerase
VTTSSKRFGVALLLVASLTAGCSPLPKTPRIPEGTSIQHVSVDGQDRYFRVFRPEKLPDATPLVIVMHGAGVTARRTERQYGWDDVAARHRFVVAYPAGIGRTWNAGGECCGVAAQRRVDDVAFITAMVERLADALPIDDERIYAAGMSNGGMMAYALACRTSLFAAIGAVAATQFGACEKPRPTSVIHVHGLADPFIRFDGTAGLFPATQPVPAVLQNWMRIDKCRKPTQSRRGSVVITRASCADGREVTLVVIAGESHTWPGRDGSRAAWDATAELWTVFSRHSLSDEPSRKN